MYKPVTLTALFLLITFSLANAQQKLYGRITEKNTGTPIAFATVQVKDAKSALSNENGEFELSVSTSPVSITVSHLNYVGINLQVSNSNQLLKITMAPQILTLKEVSVGNPAIAIMQEVSDKAREHIDQSYYRKAFLRQMDEDNIHKNELNPIKINVNDSQLSKAMTYNETFWRNNQGVKRTEKEQSAIEILEKTPQVKK